MQSATAAAGAGETTIPMRSGFCWGIRWKMVRGFVENQGKNFLCSGYWKVYANRREAEALFALYEDTREQAVRMLAEKRDIRELWGGCRRPEDRGILQNRLQIDK